MPLATAPGDAWSRLSRYPGKVVMLRAMIPRRGEDKHYRLLNGWERLVTNEIELRMVSGAHGTIWHPDNVGAVVSELED